MWCSRTPASDGEIRDIEPLVKAAKERNALVTVDADLLALTLLKSPGELGADIAVGNTQRFWSAVLLWWSACRLHGCA